MISFKLCLAALIALTYSTSLIAAQALTSGEPYDFGIHPSPHGSEAGWLSDYHPPLAGTVADTPVFIFEGTEPGGTLFILGGTHMREPASRMAAIVLAEQARVRQGRLVVVPYGNALAVDPERERLTFQTDNGERRFYHGGRRSLPRHYADEDPERYLSPSGEERAGREHRNLNRVFPGVAEGTPTEQIGYAITRLIASFETDIAMDLHETSNFPGSIAWTIAGIPDHEAILEEAVDAVNEVIQLDLMMTRPTDTGPGLSRIEWGAATGAKAFLTETVYAGATPMRTRVGIQLESIQAIIEACNNKAEPDRQIRLDGVPTFEQLAEHGVGHFLQRPE